MALARMKSVFGMAAAAVVVLAGCRGGGRLQAESAGYPLAVPAGEPVDVHVLRDTTTISLTNTSVQPLGPGTMWLNGRYGREIERIEVGERVSYQLGTFRDQYGDAFRGGGFWAMEPPDVLVRAEVEAEGERIGLVVIQQDD